MSDNNEDSGGVNAKGENLEFINQIIDQELNHLVRQDEEVEGMFNIQVQSDGNFTIRLYRGTENEARTIEDVSKDKLLSLMEDKL